MKTTIYLGPSMSLNGFTISKGTIFAGAASDEVEQKKNSDPEFAALFVEPHLVAKERRGLQDNNSYLALCYQNVNAKYLAKKESK